LPETEVLTRGNVAVASSGSTLVKEFHIPWMEGFSENSYFLWIWYSLPEEVLGVKVIKLIFLSVWADQIGRNFAT
jgi:hypothetical protein